MNEARATRVKPANDGQVQRKANTVQSENSLVIVDQSEFRKPSKRPIGIQIRNEITLRS